VSSLNHLKGVQILTLPQAKYRPAMPHYSDMKDHKGQDTVRRVLEIAAAGGQNLLMVGSPGAGKLMLAARLAGLLPALSAAEVLQVNMLHLVVGRLVDGRLIQARPALDSLRQPLENGHIVVARAKHSVTYSARF
jgi:magnesium chelatase family protein